MQYMELDLTLYSCEVKVSGHALKNTNFVVKQAFSSSWYKYHEYQTLQMLGLPGRSWLTSQLLKSEMAFSCIVVSISIAFAVKNWWSRTVRLSFLSSSSNPNLHKSEVSFQRLWAIVCFHWKSRRCYVARIAVWVLIYYTTSQMVPCEVFDCT